MMTFDKAMLDVPKVNTAKMIKQYGEESRVYIKEEIWMREMQAWGIMERYNKKKLPLRSFLPSCTTTRYGL